MKITLLEPIGVSEDYLTGMKKLLEKEGHEFEYYTNRVESDDEVIKRGKDANILIVSNLPLNEKVIKSCEQLKMITVAFSGVDHIDVKTCNEKNILVSNAAEYSTFAVAELTMGLIISLLRNINPMDDVTRNLGHRQGFLGKELNGKILGIIGTGRIGLKVAEFAHVFGCQVLAYNRSRKDVAYIGYVELKELLERSDIISVNLPLTEGTKRLLNKETMANLKKNSILVNTARGAIIDYQVLAEKLVNHEIAGAAIDVYESEPPIPEDHPLLNAPNTILLPHIGFATHEAINRRAEIVFQNVLKFIEGKPQNVMNFVR